MIWVGSVIGVMGKREDVQAYAQANACGCRTRLRNFADLFDPNRAGISEAVIPPTSQFIGQTRRTAAAQAFRHQPAGDQSRQ